MNFNVMQGILRQKCRWRKPLSTIAVRSLLRCCLALQLAQQLIERSWTRCRGIMLQEDSRSTWTTCNCAFRCMCPATRNDDRSWERSCYRCYSEQCAAVWRSCMSRKTWIGRAVDTDFLNSCYSRLRRRCVKPCWLCFDNEDWLLRLMPHQRT